MAETDLPVLLQQCFVPKLSKDFSEINDFSSREPSLLKNYPQLIKLLVHFKVDDKTDFMYNILSQLYLFYKELQSCGPWNTELCKSYSDKLKNDIDLIYGLNLSCLFENQDYDKSIIFNKCLEYLHTRLTEKEYRKHPSLIDVYCLLIEDIKKHDVDINVQKTIVFTLILLGDISHSNKVKGLKCSEIILEGVSTKDFANSNYYEVIYETLIKVTYGKDISNLKSCLKSLLLLLKKVPKDDQEIKADQLLLHVLDRLYVESNIYKKATLFNYLPNLIEINGVNCIKRKKKFFANVLLCLDNCTEDGVSDVILAEVVTVLEIWIQYCWTAWSLCLDHELLSKLLKINYLARKNANIIQRITHLIITLIILCTKEEQTAIMEKLKKNNTPFIKNLLEEYQIENTIEDNTRIAELQCNTNITSNTIECKE